MTIESGHYPDGAEFDPSAPWNEIENPETEVEVDVIITLKKRVKIRTSDYQIEFFENNEIEPDFSFTDFNKEVEHQVILPHEMYKYVENNIYKKDFSGWEVIDIETEQV